MSSTLNPDDDSIVDLSSLSITDDQIDTSVLPGGTMAGYGAIPSIGNITISNGGSYYSSSTMPTITLGGTGAAGYTWASSNPSVYATNGVSGVNVSSALKVSGDADIDGDLRVGGRSILESLERIEKRLAILVPDPARLDKYEALKQAWEHYKTLEALCVEQDHDPDKG